MRVVIDTNILISGADDEYSISYRIIGEVIAGRLTAYATHQTMSENRQMLRKLVRDRDYKTRLEEYFSKLKIVKPPLHLPLTKGEKEREWIVSDPEDNKLFESAAAAGADYLITRDQEVLSVGEYQNTKVQSPENFWAVYQAQQDRGNSAWTDWSRMIMGQ